MAGCRDAFQWLDRNGDGVLMRAEAVGEQNPSRKLFDLLYREGFTKGYREGFGPRL